MSAAPGTEFPNPCPVCGSTDEHAEFRARANGMGCTFCPHPAQPGHGTGCCCAGRSKPLMAYSLTELGLPAPSSLEQRIADLEATVDRLLNPVAAPEWTDEQIAHFKEEFEAAAKQFPSHVLRHLPLSPPNLLNPETVRQLLRESVTIVKPGEVLFLVCPENRTPMQIREIQDCVNWWLADNAPDIRVLVLPYGEMAVAEPEPA